jgi:sortase (surface protein transpeptidase)
MILRGGHSAGAGGRAFRKPAPRHRRPPKRRRLVQSAGLLVMGCGVLAAALGLGGWALAGQHTGLGHTAPPDQVPVPLGLTAQTPGGAGHRKVPAPVRLVIPAIGVSSRLIRLGITSNNTLQVPVSAAIAGWFTGGPRPGAVGASIIAGHIDSYSGPGVFFRLRELHRGQGVYVTRANGSAARFRIIAVRTYAKDRFPTAKVYGPVPDPELRLITCGGQFDYATGSYLSNVVVYAVLVR